MITGTEVADLGRAAAAEGRVHRRAAAARWALLAPALIVVTTIGIAPMVIILI